MRTGNLALGYSLWKHLLLVLFLWTLAGTPWAQSRYNPEPVNISAIGSEPLSLTAHFSILEDSNGALTVADVQSPSVAARFNGGLPASNSLNLGFTNSAYWLRLNLHNPEEKSISRILQIAYARLGNIELHQVGSNHQAVSYKTGINRPFISRPYPNRFFVFPLTLPPQSQDTLYLRIQSKSSLLIPASLWTPEAFHRLERRDYISQAWYFGIVSAILVLNLLLFLVLRNRSFLLYVAYVASTGLTFAAENGLADEFLWGQFPQWSVMASLVGYSVTLGTVLPFMRRMLETRVNAPRLDPWLKRLTVVLLASPVIFALSPVSLTKAAIFLYLFTVLLFFVVCVVCARNGQRIAYIFLLAFLGLGVGGTLYVLRTLGILPSNALTLNAMQIGSALELLLLSFALANRFDVLRHEKDQAMQAKFEAQRLLVDNLRSAERTLEDRVSRRTEELKKINALLEAQNATDDLTGIANRRHFDQALAIEWARATRSGQPLALAMLDIDWFKSYNDHFGHQAGDTCLRAVAQHFSSQISRAGDLVARYGGEEFVLLTPATDDQAALTLARLVCTSLQALGMPHAMSEYGCITVSIGVATWTPTANDEPSALIEAADRALYQAKSLGRNQAQLG